jgi:hypothetical protein
MPPTASRGGCRVGVIWTVGLWARAFVMKKPVCPTPLLAACRRERFPGHLTALCSTAHNPIVTGFSHFSPTNC